MDISAYMTQMGKKAKEAARIIGAAPPAMKSEALERLADLLVQREAQITAANELDLEAARQRGMDAPRMDRLRLTPAIIAEMASACRQIAAMPDPVGALESQWQRPNGLLVGKMRIPLGVIAMIYESRPNVTVDSGILCLKAGNAVILRGGSEAIHSNLALAALVHEALEAAGLPRHAVQVVETTDRAAIEAMCKLEQYIDVIIPRGGESLIRNVVQMATMPVLKHYEGVCHAYVDQGADLAQALEVVMNSKTHRPGVCNALEGLLVHADEAQAFLPMVAERLGGAGVEFRACPRSLPLLGKTAVPMREDDPGTEFHALILLVKVVDSMREAQDHIAAYGSNHTELICTRDHNRAMQFVREVDASMVAVNASSRFNDGGQLGLGAEIGISTSKLHSYGPMGVTELTTTKFVVFGRGQVRA
ncbi:glutamate-5-semialdehyde dehydrogenase [Desulfovibrio psychrotolerans]|uniref:Gamma-glutamyl phosphate reductase n=1 Tax=Desulfovibrio psychrotolerans TaxID=415242 RepID=A0A7J0BR25_9BACT|nr:glutamate-5-semialdehyde dehydrogenase [Desulfovibrio psychrotolerans]GFM35651.1 gamma-glutamyl phosphate reductase [Desulfovibrio psychrotolerans]